MHHGYITAICILAGGVILAYLIDKRAINFIKPELVTAAEGCCWLIGQLAWLVGSTTSYSGRNAAWIARHLAMGAKARHAQLSQERWEARWD